MVGGINNNLYRYSNNVSFSAKNNMVNPQPKKNEALKSDSFESEKSISTAAKVGIGTAIAAAVAVGADYLFAKGKHVKSILKAIKGGEKTVKETTETVVETTQKAKTPAAAQTAQTVPAQSAQPAKPSIQETADKAAKEAQEKLAKEAQEKAAKEAQEKAAKEAQEKAAKEAQEKAAKEAQEKAAKEAQEKAAKEAQRLAAKQTEFERVMDFSKKYVDEHMKELDNLLIDSNGKIHETWLGNSKLYSLDELIQPYKGKVEYFYHGTTPENKAAILKNGFNQRIAPKHGYLDGVGGTYFSVAADTGYGEGIIKAKFKGKIAEIDTNLFDSIKIGNRMRVIRHLEESGMTLDEAGDYCEAIMRDYLKQKIINKGYQGVIGSGYSYQAGCKYFAALDPKLIQIVE